MQPFRYCAKFLLKKDINNLQKLNLLQKYNEFLVELLTLKNLLIISS